MSGHRCFGCGSNDGTPGYTIGATLCYPCRVKRNERRAAYYAARDKDDARTAWLFGFALLAFVVVFGACFVQIALQG